MTKRPNEKNERMKRDFLNYRKHAKQLSEKTLDREIAALERFDVWNGRKDFGKLHIDWPMGFRTYLDHAKGARGKPLGKSIDTFFAKGFDEAEEVLAKWMAHLDQVVLYGPDDPLFPATALEAEESDGFKASGFQRRNWTTTEPVRKIVNAAFKNAGLPAFGPHAFRQMLSRHIAKTCKSVAELVASSQNLDQTDVLTTLRNYGHINRDDQRKLVTGEEPRNLQE